MSEKTGVENKESVARSGRGSLGGLIFFAIILFITILVVILSSTPSPESAFCNTTDASAFKYMVTGRC